MVGGADRADSHYQGDGRLALKFLNLDEVTMIDESLDEPGEYGPPHDEHKLGPIAVEGIPKDR